jgi:hypothetical protein
MTKRKAEWVPWYRERSYKGNLSEAEKRQLDAFRTQPKHPAATFDDLPEEVQSYLSGIQLELYDKKQESVADRAFFFSAIAGGLLFLNYKSCFPTPDVWTNAGAVLLLLFAWFQYWRQWGKNAEEFTPAGATWRPTEEGIRREWELNYLFCSRQKPDDVSASAEPFLRSSGISPIRKDDE